MDDKKETLRVLIYSECKMRMVVSQKRKGRGNTTNMNMQICSHFYPS